MKGGTRKPLLFSIRALKVMSKRKKKRALHSSGRGESRHDRTLTSLLEIYHLTGGMGRKAHPKDCRRGKKRLGFLDGIENGKRGEKDRPAWPQHSQERAEVRRGSSVLTSSFIVETRDR